LETSVSEQLPYKKAVLQAESRKTARLVKKPIRLPNKSRN
jgi:hypothetical protein